MEFLLSICMFSSDGAHVSRKELGKPSLQEWVAREDNKGAAAGEQGETQRRQDEPRAQPVIRGPQEKKPQRRRCFAPEFDGLNCFETIVSH